jgi:hypothetical protein
MLCMRMSTRQGWGPWQARKSGEMAEISDVPSEDGLGPVRRNVFFNRGTIWVVVPGGAYLITDSGAITEHRGDDFIPWHPAR